MSFRSIPPQPLLYSISVDPFLFTSQTGIERFLLKELASKGYRVVCLHRVNKDYNTHEDTYVFEVEDMNLIHKIYPSVSPMGDPMDMKAKSTYKKPKKRKEVKTKETPVTQIEVNFDMITYDDPSFYIPEEWTKLLTHTKNAYIAGGSIRDLELGAVVKDVDVFINVTAKDDFVVRVQQIIYGLGILDKNVIRFDGDYQDPKTGENVDGLDNEVGLVVKLKTDNFSYDIIGRKGIDSLDKVVAQFDLGICQIGYDGNTIQCSENYIRDKACKTITILKPMKFGTNGWAHMVRVAEKYKSYKLV